MIPRFYKDFRGVDYANKDLILSRSPSSLNMWKNYKASLGNCIETRPDIELVTAYANTVYGIFFYKVGLTVHTIVHSGTKLYDNGVEKYTGMNPAKSLYFVYNNILFIKDGINYLEYNGTTVKSVVGFIPTTIIYKKPTGEGKELQKINVLTGVQKNTFVPDGISKEYFVSNQNLDVDYTEIITVNGTLLTKGVDFTVNSGEGKFTFTDAPESPINEGDDVVVIQFSKTIAGSRSKIEKCTLLSVFDNRVFFSGNQDYTGGVFYSMLGEPRYVSEDFYQDGLDTSKVNALVVGNGTLWVFKEPTQNGNSVYYHRPVIDSEEGKVYPNEHSNISVGCVSTGINFNDDIVFFSDRGLEAINGDISSEQLLAHRSSLIDAKLLLETNYGSLKLEEYEGYLLVIIDNKIYLADSKQIFQEIDHTEYEWYYWEMSKTITCTAVDNGILYIGTADGVYSLTKTPTNLNCEWTTPDDVFGYPNMTKTTNKRGGIVEMTGAEIKLSTKTDNGSFIELNTFTNTKNYIVFKLKKKKFKSLQLKLSSTKPFKLFLVSLEVFVGTYIKR